MRWYGAGGRVGLQAVLALMIAWWVSDALDLHRAYWVGFGVLMVIAPSWGESLRNVVAVVAATLFGCALAIVLHHWLGDSVACIGGLIVGCLFLRGWYAMASVLLRTFFTGLAVILFMGARGLDVMDLAWLRIETITLGGVIATTVCAVVAPRYEARRFRELVLREVECGRWVLERLLGRLFQDTQDAAMETSYASLLAAAREVRCVRETALQEMMMQPARRRRVRRILTELSQYAHALFALCERVDRVREVEEVRLVREPLQTLGQQLLALTDDVLAAFRHTRGWKRRMAPDVCEAAVRELRARADGLIAGTVVHGRSEAALEVVVLVHQMMSLMRSLAEMEAVARHGARGHAARFLGWRKIRLRS